MHLTDDETRQKLKQKLLDEYAGKRLKDLPTPALVIDRRRFAENSERVLASTKELGIGLRTHIKTHKTTEGVALQIGVAPDGASSATSRVIVSTTAEFQVLRPLAKRGLVTDVLYGLPVVKSRVPELIDAMQHFKTVRIMVDHEDQLALLDPKVQWSAFIKVDDGYHRAGKEAGSAALQNLIRAVIQAPHVSLHGFYCHAGDSYGAHSVSDAESYLLRELSAGEQAAAFAQSIAPGTYTVSVGATPTAHAAVAVPSTVSSRAQTMARANCPLELHAGNFPLCDLQQVATGCTTADRVAISVLCEVASLYPGRRGIQPGEVLVNAGCIALGREPGQFPGYGDVATTGFTDWYAWRISQEHGILMPKEGSQTPQFPAVGSVLRLLPQHACIAANAYPYFYVVDGSDSVGSVDDTVVDIWIPVHGW